MKNSRGSCGRIWPDPRERAQEAAQTPKPLCRQLGIQVATHAGSDGPGQVQATSFTRAFGLDLLNLDHRASENSETYSCLELWIAKACVRQDGAGRLCSALVKRRCVGKRRTEFHPLDTD